MYLETRRLFMSQMFLLVLVHILQKNSNLCQKMQRSINNLMQLISNHMYYKLTQNR